MKKKPGSFAAWFFVLLFGFSCLAFGQEFTAANSNVEVHGLAVQSADDPVLLTLTVKNVGHQSCRFGPVGPALLPDANNFSAQYVDAQGEAHPLLLQNWQDAMSDGLSGELKPGESIDLHVAATASLPPVNDAPIPPGNLPPGKYVISVLGGPPFPIEVKQDENLRHTYAQAVIDGIHQNSPTNPFFERVAEHYPNDAVNQALVRDLTSDNPQFVLTAATMLFYLHGNSPKNGEKIYQQVLQKSLAGGIGNFSTAVSIYVVGILARCQTDTAMDSILAMAHGTEEGEIRRNAVGGLILFPQPRAREELRGFLQDKDELVRYAAAQQLASKKDPKVLEALLAMATDTKFSYRYGISPLLFDFRDDPRVKPMLEKMAADPDPQVSDSAKQYLERLAGAP